MGYGITSAMKRLQLVFIVFNMYFAKKNTVQAVKIVHQQIKQGTPSQASRVLIEEVLQKASKKHGFTFTELSQLRAGRERRRRHDDTTVVILFFDQTKN